MSSLWSALQALVFVGSLGLLLSLLGASVLFALIRRRTWAIWTAAAAGSLVSAYAFMLLMAGAVSQQRVIPHGDAKAFCEIDCHVAYEVTSAYDSANNVVLTVREEFDPGSISRTRGDAPLHPGGRVFALVDADGRRWPPARVRMLDSAPLFARMRPGESHRAQLVFDVPHDVAIAGLLVEDDSPISPLLIGHERSPLHRKTLLALPEGATRARAERAPSARVRRG